MSQKDKLIKKLKSLPKDFTLEEADSLLGYLSYSRSEKGKTSGSRVEYYNEALDASIGFHRPHPQKELPHYVVKRIKEELEGKGLI